MSATPAVTIVNKSVGWSIGLSVLMIIGGYSGDRFTPGGRNRRKSVGRLAARFQRMRPSGVCLAHAELPEEFSGSYCSAFSIFSSVYICCSSCGGLGVTDACTGDLPVPEGVLEFVLSFTSARFRDRVGCYSMGSSH